jgi:hypothetical protein
VKIVRLNFLTKRGPACLYARAKDRALGEQACRPCKTPHLEVRPVSGRTTASPRGPVLVVLGADRIMRALQQAWAQLELTGAEGRAPRAPLGVLDVPLAGPGTCWRLPTPRAHSQRLWEAVGPPLPEPLLQRKARVVPRKPGPERRTKRKNTNVSAHEPLP